MFKPQIRIPATYMRGGWRSFRFEFLLKFKPVAAGKCDFPMLASIAMLGCPFQGNRGTAS
ncbi:hypothetical protein [Bowmanella yangjiangensis]|uniref:Uncharacterized protein n=1 Tax=Bowmanella yangjiangensis TaxID=2811230 RepID=A0ABS3CTP4_9ALTE|nr:hypothetical protein [Bowmanella yangjiangensis]MBN7820488.1 hypothetical protein [Bowmanella yangjiangensis]